MWPARPGPGPKANPARPARALDPTQRPLLSSGPSPGVLPVTGAQDTALPLRDPGTRSRREPRDDGEEARAAHVSAAASELFLQNKVEVSVLGAST